MGNKNVEFNVKDSFMENMKDISINLQFDKWTTIKWGAVIKHTKDRILYGDLT
jgi:hypothetical protein